MLPSISSTFYASDFHTKFWRQKYQSCVLGLKFFGAKILYEKHVSKTLMKLTAARKTMTKLTHNETEMVRKKCRGRGMREEKGRI